MIIGKANQMRDEADMMGKKIEAYWIREHKWFFKWDLTHEEIALFDMENDPKNDWNVAPKYPDLVKQFQRTIDQWRKNPELVD